MHHGDDTLRLWEALLAVPPVSRAAALLAHRGVAADLDEALDLPLATAEAVALSELRDRSEGVVATVVTCADCDALLDVPLDLDALVRSVAADPADGAHEKEPEIVVDGMVLRSPTTRDLVVALAAAEPADVLRERCVRPSSPGAALDDPDVQARVEAAFERLTGAAGLSVRTQCPECGASTTADVDVTGLLSDRLADQAYALFVEVADLASAYGWSEPQILALPEGRRRAYLELARR